MAAELARALRQGLSPKLVAALAETEVPVPGDWYADRDLTASVHQLDSAVLVSAVDSTTIEGREHVVRECSWLLQPFETRAEQDPVMAWLVLHRSLVTAPHYQDWLTEQEAAGCRDCGGAANTTVHVLVQCIQARRLWYSLLVMVQRVTGVSVWLSVKYVLFNLVNSSQQKLLQQCQWWETMRAAALHTLWVNWTRQYIGKGRGRLLPALMAQIWTHLVRRGAVLAAGTRKVFLPDHWVQLGAASIWLPLASLWTWSGRNTRPKHGWQGRGGLAIRLVCCSGRVCK